MFSAERAADFNARLQLYIDGQAYHARIENGQLSDDTADRDDDAPVRPDDLELAVRERRAALRPVLSTEIVAPVPTVHLPPNCRPTRRPSVPWPVAAAQFQRLE